LRYLTIQSGSKKKRKKEGKIRKRQQMSPRIGDHQDDHPNKQRPKNKKKNVYNSRCEKEKKTKK